MAQPTRVWIHGYSGRMGTELQQLLASDPHRWDLIGGTARRSLIDFKANRAEEDWESLPKYLANADLIIDFSVEAANASLLAELKNQNLSGKSLLIGTTGLKCEQKKAWEELATKHELKLLLAPNTSLGILLTMKVSELLAQVLSPLHFDIEILETHHRAKLDAPSGTAKLLGDNLVSKLKKEIVYGREGKRQRSEIGLASLRGGSVFGEHEVRFLGDHEELKVSHRALNRQLFAQGALLLAQWLLQKRAGNYRLEDVSIEEMVQLLRKEVR